METESVPLAQTIISCNRLARTYLSLYSRPDVRHIQVAKQVCEIIYFPDHVCPTRATHTHTSLWKDAYFKMERVYNCGDQSKRCESVFSDRQSYVCTEKRAFFIRNTKAVCSSYTQYFIFLLAGEIPPWGGQNTAAHSSRSFITDHLIETVFHPGQTHIKQERSESCEPAACSLLQRVFMFTCLCPFFFKRQFIVAHLLKWKQIMCNIGNCTRENRLLLDFQKVVPKCNSSTITSVVNLIQDGHLS